MICAYGKGNDARPTGQDARERLTMSYHSGTPVSAESSSSRSGTGAIAGDLLCAGCAMTTDRMKQAHRIWWNSRNQSMAARMWCRYYQRHLLGCA